MATTRNRPKSTNISKSAIDQVGSLLQDLSAKPREEMSLREAIDQLREPIQGAMARGYSYEDIVKILGEKGIPTTVTTVKRYISLGNSPKRKASTKGRTKRAHDSEPVDADEASESPSESTGRSTADSEAAPKTRGRRKADSSTTIEAEPETTKTGRAKSSTRATTPRTPGRGRRKTV
jgi:hypothetical protein